MRLALASAFTLSLLSAFLLAVVTGLMLATGIINFPLALLLIAIINFVIWLVSPKISDFIYRYFYDMEWITIEELRKKSSQSADVIERVTEKYDYNQPKLGLIKDNNPNAFTYGSGRWNGRIIVSEGLFKYCNDEEASAVYAHELGHITNRDFIIMTIANTIVQLLYIIAIRAYRMSAEARDRGAAMLVGVAVISFIFYYLGNYLVLYLSRVREYYADKFAAEHTDGDYLSSALIKISYGIMAEPNDKELVKATENIGLMNFEDAEDTGALYYNCENLNNFEPLNKAFLYDLKNPWAKIQEIKSTHPLTAKRIRAMMGRKTGEKMFDFEGIEERYPVDTGKLYKQFFKDLSVLGVPRILALAFPLAYGAGLMLNMLPASILLFLGGWISLYGVSKIVQTLYKYPRKEAEQKTVIDLMSDIYASPVRGDKVKLDGEIIGKGQAGYKFSEDVMFKDDTGIMFIRYESWLPFFGNLIFALNKVPDLIGEKVSLNGWFLRGQMPWIGMRTLNSQNDVMKGYIHLIGIIGGFLMVIAGVGMIIAYLSGFSLL